MQVAVIPAPLWGDKRCSGSSWASSPDIHSNRTAERAFQTRWKDEAQGCPMTSVCAHPQKSIFALPSMPVLYSLMESSIFFPGYPAHPVLPYGGHSATDCKTTGERSHLNCSIYIFRKHQDKSAYLTQMNSFFKKFIYFILYV